MTGSESDQASEILAHRLKSLTHPDTNITTWTYTSANEVATELNPPGHPPTFSYDLNGNVTSKIDPNSHQITYSYDADNEQTGETWVNPGMGSPLNLVTISYDPDGDITQIRDATSNYQFTYNADDEVSTFADNGTTGLPLVTLTYGYDGNNNVTSESDSLGGLLTLPYDPRDELTNEKFTATALSAEAVTYAYDDAGRLTGLTRYSNTAETTKVAATADSYDHADRMKGIVDTNSTGATLVTYGYTYDAADRVSQEVRTWNSGTNADTLTYSYTNNNQLTGVSHSNGSFTNESFSRDSNGNENGTGFTTGTDNEQTASPGYTYTYDNAGEMTSETNTSTGNVWTYGYDFRGRMVTAVEKTSGGTTLESVTYTYDALDNRIGMDENGTQTWTLYDRGNPIMDFNSSGSLTMRYLYGATGIVARQTSGGTVSWYLADHLGTVRDLINNSGAIINHVDFSAFGTVLGETNPASGDRMTAFAMLERDTATGLNVAVHRTEQPIAGRWTSPDPFGFAAGDANLDRYTGNDPAGEIDPSGLLIAEATGTAVAVSAGTGLGAVTVAAGPAAAAIGAATIISYGLGQTIVRPYLMDPFWNWILGNGPYSPPLPRPGPVLGPGQGPGPSPDPRPEPRPDPVDEPKPEPRPGPGSRGNCPPSDIFIDEFDNPGDAIGDVSAQGPTRAGNTETTTQVDIYNDGYTQTQYWRGSDGIKYTVYYNPCRGTYAGAHPSGSQRGGPGGSRRRRR